MTVDHWFLASASPRRAQLLQQIALPFSVISAAVDESVRPAERAHDYVSRLAIQKARAGWQGLSAQQQEKGGVIAADTSVVIAEHIIGKPSDRDDALAIWQKLNNTVHQVMTGVCVKTAMQERHEVCVTDVYFRAVAHEEWLQYWETGEPQDKAGAYGIQGYAARFITRIDGSYSNVVGLPLHLVDAFCAGA